jgi:hypothetical protein
MDDRVASRSLVNDLSPTLYMQRNQRKLYTFVFHAKLIHMSRDSRLGRRVCRPQARSPVDAFASLVELVKLLAELLGFRFQLLQPTLQAASR